MCHSRNYSWKISTQALHAGEEKKFSDSHITPIFASSTFLFPNVEIGKQRFTGEDSGYIYSRYANPTVEVSEKKIAVLEGAELLKRGIPIEGHAFATGMACISTVIMALTKANDTVIATNPLYGGTNYLLDGVMKNYSVRSELVETSGEEGIEKVKTALTQNTKLIYLESPANPNLAICDIEEISKIGQENEIPVVIDNTFATPVLQRPLELGVDISLHSTTKYLNGHGTSVSGILASKLTGDKREGLIFMKKTLGATQSPFDAFLVSNGMKTLPLRMREHCKNAQGVAEYLVDHPKVSDVYYPGLKSHPQYTLAKKQMKGFGGMLALELKGGKEAGKVLMNNLNVFTLAVSLGCVDSLIQHPASMTHVNVSRDVRIKGGITDGLVRVSVGIEDLNDLIEDLSQGLTKVPSI
ncbi:MAG: trans-sulfuration enzyme family protein [Candidatus Hodarchaeales archaeon]|jgi:methionine-gamma-lyase